MCVCLDVHFFSPLTDCIKAFLESHSTHTKSQIMYTQCRTLCLMVKVAWWCLLSYLIRMKSITSVQICIHPMDAFKNALCCERRSACVCSCARESPLSSACMQNIGVTTAHNAQLQFFFLLIKCEREMRHQTITNNTSMCENEKGKEQARKKSMTKKGTRIQSSTAKKEQDQKSYIPYSYTLHTG